MTSLIIGALGRKIKKNSGPNSSQNYTKLENCFHNGKKLKG